MKGLHNLHRARGSMVGKTRIGRGSGSGIGTYSGRGIKGQRARSGGRSGIVARSMRAYLLRIPKVRGFKSPMRGFAVVNVGELQTHYKDGDVVNPNTLRSKGLLTGTRRAVKILSTGTLSKKLTVTAHGFSDKAKELIEKAGGRIEMLVQAGAKRKEARRHEKKS